MMYHGIINVYKEAGFTSHDVVAKLRGISKQKKIGHTGTLDPDAVGVLPVCLGNATKVCDMLTDRTKEYVAVLRLGVETDTQDSSGNVLRTSPVEAGPAEVQEAVFSFLGDSMQIPPMYSALKVNGKKLYELARAGKQVERAARPIHIEELEILEENPPVYTIRVVCSKGTYIRTLCHDIGRMLGCGGVMESLMRTRVGEFKAEDASSLSYLQELMDAGRLEEVITPVEALFTKLSPLYIKEEGHKALNNGNQLKVSECRNVTIPVNDGEEFRVYRTEGEFCGIYRYEAQRGLFCPVKLFMTGE